MLCKQSEIVSPVHSSELSNSRLPKVTSAAADTDPSLPSGAREGKKVGWRAGKEEVGKRDRGGVEVGLWRAEGYRSPSLPGVLFTQTHTSSPLAWRCRRWGEK